KTVRLGGTPNNTFFYTVVGVLEDRMPTSAVGGSSQTQEDFNLDIYLPMQTYKGRFGERTVMRQSGSWNSEQVELSQVTLTVKDRDSVKPAGDVVKDLLTRFHGSKSGDWKVTIPLDLLVHAEEEKERFLLLLFLIGFISLFVGGIGIMN